MVDLILIHSDQIVAALFLLMAVTLLIARPKVTCCRRHRWERHLRGDHRRG